MIQCRDEQIDQNEFELDIVTDRYVLSSTIRAPIRPALITVPEAFTSKYQFTEPKTTVAPTVIVKTTIEPITETISGIEHNEPEFETTTLVSQTQPTTSSEAER